MTKTLERTTVDRYEDIILTAGMIDGATGKQIFGMFDSEEDARSEDCDDLAIGTVGAADLTTEQIELAERNSEALSDAS